MPQRSHGHSNPPTATYNSWTMMKNRCGNQNNNRWHIYGGRGITVCKRWNVFTNFLADMGERPSGTSLERINNNGHYQPSNCRWATIIEQGNNKRNNYLITLNGETKTRPEWARLLGLSQWCIRSRLARGWSIEKTLTTPKLSTSALRAISRRNAYATHAVIAARRAKEVSHD